MLLEYGIHVSRDLALFERMVSSVYVKVSSSAHFVLGSCKGEECIPQTWDMFHEKWGFMVIFWNFAGVPFVSLWNRFDLVNCSDTAVIDRPMFTRSSTWLPTNRKITGSRPRLTSRSSRHCSRHTTCG